MFFKQPNILCNNQTIRAILASIIPRFPNINMPILAFVGVTSRMCDFYITTNIDRKHIPAYFAMSAEERQMEELAWVGAYPPIPKYVMLINESEWFQTFRNQKEMVGGLAHELAHLELWSNADIDIMLSRKLIAKVEASKSSTLHTHSHNLPNAHLLGSNEFVTDALAIGRGFGYELSACLKALGQSGREYERCGIPVRVIDESLRACDYVPYRIAAKGKGFTQLAQ